LFFRKKWARRAWLVFLILTLHVHFFMTAIQFFAAYSGYSGLARVYVWIGMVIFVSIISWAYLCKATIKAGFH
jgi:capsular polysaccharide biosynthesis protein